MRLSQVLVTSAITIASVVVMTGWSGSGSASSSSILPTSSGMHTRAVPRNMTGVAPQFLASLHFGTGLPAVRPDAGGVPKSLAVSDSGSGAVEVLNSNYTLKRTITTGLNGPDGDWYDSHGNLYVADAFGANVQEYAPGTTSPSFTYSTGLLDPINVATDEAGHVFVTDFNFAGNGFVNEYSQKSNTVVNSCSPGGAPEGVAVGECGQVFVYYNSSAGGARIAEYKNRMTGCNEVVLGVQLNSAAGLQLDNHKNLVACDQGTQSVDIIAPPYNSVTSSITGFNDSFHVALNETNTLVFVADPANANVVVDNYPSGSNVTTRGSGNGLTDPYGVATNPFQH